MSQGIRRLKQESSSKAHTMNMMFVSRTLAAKVCRYMTTFFVLCVALSTATKIAAMDRSWVSAPDISEETEVFNRTVRARIDSDWKSQA